jgi:hypothetical protein
LEVKFYKDNDEKSILELFKIVYGRELTWSFWNWRFKRNPIFNTFISLIFEDELLVSQYAVCPIYFLINEIEVKVALSMTTMTHPNHVGKGYFKVAALKLYEK